MASFYVIVIFFLLANLHHNTFEGSGNGSGAGVHISITTSAMVFMSPAYSQGLTNVIRQEITVTILLD
jgi:hypothetical protein